MRFLVFVFLSLLFASALLYNLAATTTTALLHESFAADPAHATTTADDAAADAAAAADAVDAVAVGHREDFRLVENPDRDLKILSRKKRDFGLILSIFGTILGVGSAIKDIFDVNSGTANQELILEKLKDLDKKTTLLAIAVLGLQTKLNEFESKLDEIGNTQILILIKSELNFLKNTADYLKQTTIAHNGKYGPSTLFGHNQIPGRLRTLRHALDNFHRYMSVGHSSFGQKPLVQWYYEKTSSIKKASAFKSAMIYHQTAGYEFLKILYIASCQQDNQYKPAGWCHAAEAAKTTSEVTNLEKTRMEKQMKDCPSPNCVVLAPYGSSEYRLVKEKKSWFEARSFCQGFLSGGDLASMESNGEWKHIHAALNEKDCDEDHWLGGYRNDKAYWSWQWASGKKIEKWNWAWIVSERDREFDYLLSWAPYSNPADDNWGPLGPSYETNFVCEIS